MKIFRSTLAWILVFGMPAWAVPSPDEAVRLYERAFERFASVEGTDLQRIREGAGPDRAAIEEGMALLKEASKAPEVEFSGMNAEMNIPPHLSRARSSVRTALGWAELEIEEDPDSALETLDAVIRTGYHVGGGSELIGYLTGVAIEGIAYQWIGQQAVRLTAEERIRLLEKLDALPPAPTVAGALMVERAERMGPWLDLVHENALEAFEQAEAFGERIRLSAVTSMGGEVSVGIDDVEQGITFWISPGETRHGIELVWVDMKADTALIRKGDESAVIRLEDRKISPLDSRELIEGLRELAGPGRLDGILAEAGMEVTPENALDAFLLVMKESVGRDYDIMIEWASGPWKPDDEADAEVRQSLSSLGQITFDSIRRVRGTEAGTAAIREMGRTAVILLDEPEAPIPDDPFREGPFEIRETEEGFELVSGFVRSGGELLSLEVRRKQ